MIRSTSAAIYIRMKGENSLRNLAAAPKEEAREGIERAFEADRNVTRVLHEQLLNTKLVTAEQWNAEIAPALKEMRLSLDLLAATPKEK